MQEDPAHPTIVPNPLTPNHYDNGTSLISRLQNPQKKTSHFSASHHPGVTSAVTSGTPRRTVSNPTSVAKEIGDASSHGATPTSNSSVRLERKGKDGRPPREDYAMRSQGTTCPLPNYGISWRKMTLTRIPIMSGKGVSVPIAHLLLKGPSTPRTPFSSTPTPHSTLRNNPPGRKTRVTSFKSVELPPPHPLVLQTTRLPKYKKTSMTPHGLVQTPPSPPRAGKGDSWLTAWELTATGGVMLLTRLPPVQAQDNEELVRLQSRRRYR